MADGLITYQELSQELRDKLEDAREINATLSQNYKSIFNSGTGKDDTGAEQDFSSIAKGQSIIKLEGLTANNLIANGDFSNGTNGWFGQLTSPTVSNGVAKFTAAQVYGGIYQIVPLVKNNVYYCSSLIKSKSNLVKLIIQRTYGYDTLITSHSGSGEFERLSVIGSIPLDVGYDSRVFVMDFRSGNWDEVSFTNTMLINLTALGLDTLTKEQCDYMFDHYINGLQGVNSGKIVSTGINLFDIYRNIDGQGVPMIIERLDDNGIKISNTVSATNTAIFYRIKLEPNTKYTIKANSTTTGSTGGGISVYDDSISVKLAGDNVTKNPLYSFTTPSDGIIKLYLYCNGNVAELNTATFTNIQLQKGSEDTQYEPYKSSELSTTLPTGMQLHRLPNGISDTIEEVNGVRQLVKRVREHILQANDITSIVTSYSNLDYVEIKKPSDYIHYGLYGSTVINTLFDKYPTKRQASETWNTASNVGYILGEASSVTFWLGVTKGAYANLASAQSALIGIKMIYQLKQPVIYKNGENGFSQIGNLEIFEKGTVYQQPWNAKQSANSKTYITYNLSDKSLIMSNSGEITSIQKFLMGRVITESGFNENGRYIKFDDGNMICWAIDVITYAINVSSGNLFVSGGAGWTFPSTFISNPSVTYNITADYTGIWAGHISSISKTHASMSVASAVSRESSNITRYMIAIGRWI